MGGQKSDQFSRFFVSFSHYLYNANSTPNLPSFPVPSKMKERKPNHEFSPHTRTRILVGYELGLTPRVLFAKEGVSLESLNKVVDCYCVLKSGTLKLCLRRLCKLSERDIRKLVQIIY